MLRVAAWNRAAKVRPANHGCLVRCHVTWWIRSRSSKSLGDRGAEAAWLNIRIRRGGKAAGAATKQAAGVADILGVQVDRPGALRQAQIGRAHVWTPATNAQTVCSLLLDTQHY